MDSLLSLLPPRLALWSSVGIVVVVTGWKVARGVAPFVRRVVHLVDDLVGEPGRPGHPARPGLMERIATLEARAADTQYQVQPNGGGSAYDRLLSTVESHVSDSERQHTAIYARLDALEGDDRG